MSRVRRLFLIGGAADRTLADFVSLVPSTGRWCYLPVVVMSHASSTPRQTGDDLAARLRRLGLHNVIVVTPRTRNLPRRARAVLMTGGDQSRLVRLLNRDRCDHGPWLLRQYRCGALIAGTSAGAAAAVVTMVAGGMSDGVLKRYSLVFAAGLGLVLRVIIDTHFSQRHRQVRMQAAIAELPDTLGIGLDEDTGILITAGHCTVFGQGRVWTFSRSRKKKAHACDDRSWLEVASSAVVTGFASGQSFDLP